MAAPALHMHLPLKFRARASLDTQQRVPYNPQRTYPKNPNTLPSTNGKPTEPNLSLTAPITTRKEISVSELLKRKIPTPNQAKLGETYLGYDTWLPNSPKVEKPRSVFNAASLAYIGDCIFELYARRHFLYPPLKIEEYNDRVMAVVRCEAQDAMLKKLMNEKFLSEEERDVLRWGKNLGSSKTRTRKRAGVAVYNRASSLETLVGYLYLINAKRLEEIMLKLGFSSGDSSHLVLEEANTNDEDGLYGSEEL